MTIVYQRPLATGELKCLGCKAPKFKSNINRAGPNLQPTPICSDNEILSSGDNPSTAQ